MISVIILTKNEEKNILDCLESVSWADEILIVDDFSKDRTEEVVNTFVQRKKIRFYKRRLENDFSAQRNFGLSKAAYDWIMFVDADERVTLKLREEINYFLIEKKSVYNGFYIPRKDVLWGKLLKHGETGNIKLLRMGKKNAGKWYGRVHEKWKIDNNVSELENYLIHYPHQSVSQFLREINFYTSIRANELYFQRQKISFWQIIFYPKGKFVLNYIIKFGFLDGVEGFLVAVFMSFHSFLVRGKLWQLWQEK